MSISTEIIARLKAEVPGLRTVEAAAELAQLFKSNGLPQLTPAAHVLATGLRGGQEQDATGMFIQPIERSYGVLLTLRNTDPAGAAAMAKVEELLEQVALALTGWAPSGNLGTLRLVRGSLSGFAQGTLTYLAEFALTDQLRIAQ